ncbi:hypothetical protein [Saccharolobus islandicus]|uniref:Uncharacterized protein n=1 Tax=Saccharolobus islandicus (strain M.16.27) TaxID=427318 RepID=C3N200_SACI3|nr:hypothetical protein [Sulfolobus islandicus]ACP54410.1 hypothetical protein M1627_0395 [Sulfolobus islandicus M.16.27]
MQFNKKVSINLNELYERFEDFLNHNSLVINNKEKYEVLFAIKQGAELKGMIRFAGDIILPFVTFFDEEKNVLKVFIGKQQLFINANVIEEFLKNRDEVDI